MTLVGILSCSQARGREPALGAGGAFPSRDATFLRGDANMDGRLSLADVFSILFYLHRGARLPCLDAADTDDSGSITSADFAYILGALFLRGNSFNGPPPPPFPRPGVDPSPDGIGCAQGIAKAVRKARSGFAADAPVDGNLGGIAGDGPEPRVLPLVDPVGTACEDRLKGADAEFIHFRSRGFIVFPGETEVRLPVLIRTLGSLEGVTLSVRSNHPDVELIGIDFSGGLIEEYASPRASWTRSFDGLREDGFVAATYALDLGAGEATLPPLYDRVIANIVISVRSDARPGREVFLTFSNTPGTDILPPIENEFVRDGKVVAHDECGLKISIEAESELFVRGDADRNRRVNLSDSVAILLHLFGSQPGKLPCEDAADVNDNGRVELADAVFLLRYLFFGADEPPPPFPYPGQETAPSSEDLLNCIGPLRP